MNSMEAVMNNLNLSFFEEYKRLDKLCGELYGDQYGISHYIDNMKAASKSACFIIPNWNTDLKQLIQIRHIRNHLAHAENAFQENNCSSKDVEWVQNFHKRILTQTDPLAILYQHSKAKQPHPKPPVSTPQTIGSQSMPSFPTADSEKRTNKSSNRISEGFNWLFLLSVIVLFTVIMGVILSAAFYIAYLFPLFY